MWILKKGQPEFEVVDGAFVGRIYRHNQQYADIPPEKAACFRKATVRCEKTEEKTAKKPKVIKKK